MYDNIELPIYVFFYEWTEICMYSNDFSKLDECVFFFLVIN